MTPEVQIAVSGANISTLRWGHILVREANGPDIHGAAMLRRLYILVAAT